MVTRRGDLPPDHTKSPARRERTRKAGENDVSAGAVIGRASGDTSGIEQQGTEVRSREPLAGDEGPASPAVLRNACRPARQHMEFEVILPDTV